jgi:hypothetical protein
LFTCQACQQVSLWHGDLTVTRCQIHASQRPNWHTYKIVAGLDRMLDQPWDWEANLVTP